MQIRAHALLIVEERQALQLAVRPCLFDRDTGRGGEPNDEFFVDIGERFVGVLVREIEIV